MSRVEFHPHADEEFQAAIRFYESRATGLGSTFVHAVRQACDGVLEFPARGRRFGSRLRRAIVAGFPYALVYQVRGDVVFVVAVAHLHRRPDYWRSRA